MRGKPGLDFSQLPRGCLFRCHITVINLNYPVTRARCRVPRSLAKQRACGWCETPNPSSVRNVGVPLCLPSPPCSSLLFAEAALTFRRVCSTYSAVQHLSPPFTLLTQVSAPQDKWLLPSAP